MTEWTSATPTEPGWYWFESAGMWPHGHGKMVLHIRRRIGSSTLTIFNPGDTGRPPSHLVGTWSTRIPEPDDA